MSVKQNVDNLCRTCLVQLNEMTSVFDSIQIKDANSILISHIIMECTSIEIISDDLLPKHICINCLSMAKQSYLFKQSCQKAQKYLTDILKQDLEPQTSLHSEFLIKNDILDTVIDANLYDNEETNSRIEYFDAEFDTIYDSNEQTNSLESENFIQFKNCEPLEKLIDQSGIQNYESDCGESLMEQSELKPEISMLENDFDDNVKSIKKETWIVDKKELDSIKQKKGYCCFCDTVFSNQYFHDHIKTCGKKPENYTKAESLMCPICKKQTSRRSILLSHRITLHPGNLPNGAVNEKNNCSSEIKQAPTAKKNKYCNFCDCLFPYRDFSAHIETCEKKPKRCTEDDYTKCPICKQIFRSRGYLTHHRMVIHRDNLPNNFKENAFTCEKCDRKFLWHIQYTRHMMTCNNTNLVQVIKSEKNDEENEQVTTFRLYCKFCQIQFHSEEEFDQHNTIHNKYIPPLSQMQPKKTNMSNTLRQKQSYCCFCDTVFSNQFFVEHVKTCEKKTENYTKADSLTCPICKKVTSRRRALLIHRITVHPERLPNYVDIETKHHVQKAHVSTAKNNRYCNFCDLFISAKLFLIHVETCEKRPENCKEEDFLKCPICEKTVLKSRYMTHHRVTAHPDNLPDNYKESVLVCKSCDRTFFRYTQYNLHMRICKGSNDLFKVIDFKELHKESDQDTVDMFKMYCKLCKTRFTDEEEFTKHIKTHENRKVYFCKKCGHIFGRYGSLMLHLRIHGDRESYLCTVCGKDFKSLKNVELHMRVHTGEKPFACDKCEMRFTQKATLKGHMISHSDKRIYKCWVCDVTFKRSGRLIEHMRDHKETSEGKEYTCEICTRVFSSSVKLKIHMRLHRRRSRVNLCTICDRTFSSSYALKVHTRLHTGEKPYVCPICKEGFPQGVSLKLHMKQHKSGGTKKSRQKRLKEQKMSEK